MSIRVSQALITGIKIIAEFRRARDIKSYLRNPKLKSVLKQLNIFISFNFGWTIEGALGYSKRIEATYLSPIVDECIVLTKIGETLNSPIIMSSEFYCLLTNKSKEFIREIGLFKWTGLKTPKVLY